MTHNRNNIARGLAHDSYSPLNRIIWEQQQERKGKQNQEKRIEAGKPYFTNTSLPSTSYDPESKKN